MTKDYYKDENVALDALYAKIDAIEHVLRMAAERPAAMSTSGRYLTGAEVCRFLHISPRTLQTLRDKRAVPFTMVGQRSILYPESKLHQMLMHNYRPGKEECK